MLRLGPDQIESAERRLTLGAAGVAAPAAAPRDPVVDTEHQRQQIFQKARDEGRLTGLKDAEEEIGRQVDAARLELEARHREAMAALDEEQTALQALGQGLSAAVQAHLDRAETLAAEVAFAAVTRLLGERLGRADLIAALCGEIVREFGQGKGTLRVGEHDHALLASIALDVPLMLDRRLAPGQCVMDTPRGQFESGLDVRLEGLKQALLQALGQAEAPR